MEYFRNKIIWNDNYKFYLNDGTSEEKKGNQSHQTLKDALHPST